MHWSNIEFSQKDFLPESNSMMT